MSLIHDIAARALHILEPEDAHRASIAGLKLGLGPTNGGPDDPILATTVAGLVLPNCVGLAAGYDKDAEVPDAMLRTGFGFVECGSVTPLPQAGNPRPRLFRLTEDRAVINRMGFNNQGLEPFADRLAARRRRGVVGANLGANKDATDRAADYVSGLTRLWGLADYFTVNVSSPNTPGLRALQGRDALDDLLGRLAQARADLRKGGGDAPLFLKVAPDLTAPEVRDIAEAAKAHRIDGLIVSNTTLARPESLRSRFAGESGGLSGAPLMDPSTTILWAFHETGLGLALIGAGGIASAADAYAKIRAGASAVQLYSALVYGGPGLVARIKRGLAAQLHADGFASMADARGQR